MSFKKIIKIITFLVNVEIEIIKIEEYKNFPRHIWLVPETFLRCIVTLFKSKMRSDSSYHNAWDARWKSTLRFAADIRENKLILKEHSLPEFDAIVDRQRQADKTIIHDSRQLH